MKHIIYHENNLKYPYLPQEDYYAHSQDNGVYIVSDGVTHDAKDLSKYPVPSEAYEVARIICDAVVENLNEKNHSIDSLKDAYKLANQKVLEFNLSSDLYKDRKINGFTIGAATTSAVWIKDYKLIYGVLDDCFVSVFNKNLEMYPKLEKYVEISAEYLDKNFDWSDIETRRHWREDIRNHVIKVGDKEYGYGVIDGRDGFDKFLQLGEIDLEKGDLVCVYSDGFINLINNKNFIKEIKDQEFTNNTYKYISKMSSDLKQEKEKTCYFIKID